MKRWVGDGMGWSGLLTRLVLASAVLAALATVGGGGAALASDAPVLDRAWLVEASTDRTSLSGELDASMASELESVGGAVLLSGRLEGSCEVTLEIAGSRQTVALASQMSVVHVEVPAAAVPAAAASGSTWSLVTASSAGSRGCAMDLEGAVLFVGDAAAYVGDDPSSYWASVRRGRGVGVR